MSKPFYCNEQTTVQTKAGKLRGFFFDGTYKFYGVHYAEAERFMAPTEVEPWEGVQDATAYGYTCQLLQPEAPSNGGEIRVPHRFWPMSEHCQNLNLWTPGLDNKKRPVMVWLHGGGFFSGSAMEHAAYDGTNLSQVGDVVVVAVNHRLNVIGYTDLSPYGEKYRHSANAGNEDLVAALRWVHDNIQAFGGDPDNVTIFGQSGGGMKVWMLMQIPEAKGLFHKAIVQSGVTESIKPGAHGGCEYDEPMDSRPYIEALMKSAGVKTVEELETIPYEALAKAAVEVTPALRTAGAYTSNPMPDTFYPGHPFKIGFTEQAQQIPVLIGTVLDEFPAFHPTSNEEMAKDPKAAIAKAYGKDVEADSEELDHLIALFRQAYPDKPLRDLADLDVDFRPGTISFIDKRVETEMAPTYSYMLTLDFELEGGNGPWHCSEIPFAFHNTEFTPFTNIEGVTDRLEQQICSAWLQFARTGNPANEWLPAWPACQKGDEACMIFDRECKVVHNHDRALMAFAKEFRGLTDLNDPNRKVEH